MVKNLKFNSLKIAILGCGNVGHFFANRLIKSNFTKIQAFTKTEEKASEFSKKFKIPTTINLSELESDIDVYIFCLPDYIVENIASQINHKNSFFIHCSGSLDIKIFERYTTKYGVIYPFQTFYKQEKYSSNIPLFVEANNEANLSWLIKFSKRISTKIHEVNYEKRLLLHIAGIFASNFTTHLIGISQELLQQNKIDKKFLNPLIKETFKKVIKNDAFLVQTGPARRGDLNLIEKHLNYLQDKGKIYDIYKLISEVIYKKYNGNKL